MRYAITTLIMVLGLTMPALAAPHTITAPLRVMILPFRPIGNVGQYAWIAAGVEQCLMSSASQPGATVLSPPPQAETAHSSINPMAVAKAANGSTLVTGTFQILNKSVRLSGQVKDVGSRKAMGSLSATGPITDLFKLEDTLSAQLDLALSPPAPQPNQQPAGTIIPYASTADTTPPPSYYNSTPDDTYYPRYYSQAYYDAAYPGWVYDDYGYLPFFSGFYFGNGVGYGYHDRDDHYHAWNGHRYVDRGNIYRRHPGHENGIVDRDHNHDHTQGTYDHDHGFVPVATHGDQGDRFGHTYRGFTGGRQREIVGHVGYRAPENFSRSRPGQSQPIVTHGIGTPAAAMSGAGFSAGASTPTGPGLNARGGHFEGGHHGGGHGEEGHR